MLGFYYHSKAWFRVKYPTLGFLTSQVTSVQHIWNFYLVNALYVWQTYEMLMFMMLCSSFSDSNTRVLHTWVQELLGISLNSITKFCSSHTTQMPKWGGIYSTQVQN
jgi:hypothetical protein